MRLGQLKILLVDDNQHIRMVLSEILRATGAKHVFEANDGAEALRMMRTRTIDIVITDLSMQPLDGIDFVRRLRNSPDSTDPMVPVIMVTGHTTFRRVGEARDVGVNEILSKPVTSRGLIERLTRVIEHPRPFVRSADYFGPDRRRRDDPRYRGPHRRLTDKPAVEID